MTATTERLHDFTVQWLICALMATLVLGSWNRAFARQCPDCTNPPPNCGTVCEVTTQAELQRALDCFDASDGASCSTIRIPLGTTLEMGNDQVTIDAAHSSTMTHPGVHLQIIGKIKFVGDQPNGNRRLFRLSNASGIRFDGGGEIFSDLDPVLHNGDPPSEPTGIAKVFSIADPCQDITIENLTVKRMNSALEIANGQIVSNLNVTNVHVDGVVDYGFYSSDRTDGRFTNCSVNTIVNEHPFRILGTNVVVENCWSYNSGKTGLWMVEGDGMTVRLFSSDERLRFGPDTGPASANGARLTDVTGSRLVSEDHVRLEMGIINGCFVNMCSDLKVGPSAPAIPLEPNRPMDETYWDDFSGSFQQETGNWNYQDIGPVNYNACFADITGDDGISDDEVDVNDLLAIITMWGACLAPPSGILSPHPPCAGDIYPNICGDHSVGVSDLLEVIAHWGSCPHPEPCAGQEFKVGETRDAPESIQDCYDQCIASYPSDSEKFGECYDACIESLCQRQVINCD